MPNMPVPQEAISRRLAGGAEMPPPGGMPMPGGMAPPPPGPAPGGAGEEDIIAMILSNPEIMAVLEMLMGGSGNAPVGAPAAGPPMLPGM